MKNKSIEELVDSKWYLHTQDSRGAFVTCGNEVIEFVESLLADKDTEIKLLKDEVENWLQIVEGHNESIDDQNKRIKQLEDVVKKIIDTYAKGMPDTTIEIIKFTARKSLIGTEWEKFYCDDANHSFARCGFQCDKCKQTKKQ